jgi:hypothetical protein
MISVQGKMTKINTVTTRQLGEMTIVGPFRLSEHSGPLYLELKKIRICIVGHTVHFYTNVDQVFSSEKLRPNVLVDER